MTEEDAASGFDCGSEPLNAFFARRAVKNDRRGLGKTYVFRRADTERELPAVLGFYTLSMSLVEVRGLPRKHRGDVPPHPLPVALIGRLAVDRRAQNRGIGGALLADALLRVGEVAEQVGCYGATVDAKDDRAVTFYRRFGFEPLPPARFPQQMFLPIAMVRAAR